MHGKGCRAHAKQASTPQGCTYTAPEHPFVQYRMAVQHNNPHALLQPQVHDTAKIAHAQQP